MTRFLLKLFILSWPLVALVIVELILPVNAFTFRNWEALHVFWRVADSPLGRLLPYTTLPGPFLPNAELSMGEQGDLGHDTSAARVRSAVWETDEFGFRDRPSPLAPELVIVGDSNVVGTGLSQQDTLAEVLSAKHGIASYSFAPSDMTTFLAESRFSDRPPRYVIIECVERYILGAFQAVTPRRTREIVSLRNTSLRRIEFALWRVKRLNLLQYLRARINGRPAPLMYAGMLFLEGTDAVRDPLPQEVSAAADTLALYVAQARSRGLHAAVLIVPNKETIYSDLLPGAPTFRVLPALNHELRARGVEVLDIEPAFREQRLVGASPYALDDTHWSAVGVRIAAGKVANWVSRNASSPTTH